MQKDIHFQNLISGNIGSSLYDGDQVLYLKDKNQVPYNIGKRGKYGQGLYDGRPLQKTTDYYAKLNPAIFAVDYTVGRHMLSLAYGYNTGNFYGEIKMSEDTVCPFLIKNGDYRKIYCSLPAPKSSLYPIIIYILYLVASNSDPKMKELFENACNTLTADDALIFCDYIEYLFRSTSAFDENVTVIDEAPDQEPIKQAYRSGELKDISEMFKCKPCRIFEGINDAYSEEPDSNIEPSQDNVDLKSIKSGKFLIDYSWNDNQFQYIKPLESIEGYIPTDNFYKILKKIDYRLKRKTLPDVLSGKFDLYKSRNDVINILLYGDPGTGKTALANALSASTGMPLYEVKFNEDSEDDEFEGKNKIIDSKLGFVETSFLKGFENGGIILMEEINLARPNVFTSVINQALEYPYYINRNGYEMIKRHPLTVIIGTMNIGTEGTADVNSACAQRFTYKYKIEQPDMKTFKSILTKLGYPKKNVNYVYDVYSKIRKFLSEKEQFENYVKELSIRQCIGALNCIEEGESPEDAIMDTIYGALAIVDKEASENVTLLLKNLRNFDTY